LALDKVHAFDAIATGALDALPLPALVLRLDGTIEYCNSEAEKVLSGSGALLRNRRLIRLGSLEEVAIQRTLFAASVGEARTAVASFSKEVAAATVHVTPIVGISTYRLRWPHAVALLVIERPTTADVLTQWRIYLGKRYGLTAAESKVLEQVSFGKDAREVSEALSLGYATVRTHLQKLFAKTGCKRQSELVLLSNGKATMR
jgi:DNA-binding CsgD family transcriptional regulator